jgi:hypothetical protein
MLSHSIDKTQRGDESTVCGRLSNYVSGRGSRIPRNARFRRHTEVEEAAAAISKQSSSPHDENPNSSEKVPDTMAEGKNQDITDIKSWSSAEDEPEETLKQTTQDDLIQTEEPPEVLQEEESVQKKEVEVMNQTTT